MIKPLIKYRVTGVTRPAPRYVLVDRTSRTYLTPTIFAPTGAVTTYDVWLCGPIRKFETLQLALAYAVSRMAADIEARSQ